jgi:hypothetical protein
VTLFSPMECETYVFHTRNVKPRKEFDGPGAADTFSGAMNFSSRFCSVWGYFSPCSLRFGLR